MNHYINLLEPSEQHYHSAASTNRKLQAAILGAVILTAVGIVSAVSSHYRFMKTATSEIQKWKAVEPEYKAALKRRDVVEWVAQNQKTLEGWSASRHDWTEVLLLIQQQIPEPSDQMQLKSLDFTERIDGLSNARAGSTNTYPLKRNVILNLAGLAKGEDGRRHALRFHANLSRMSGPDRLIQSAELGRTDVQSSVNSTTGTRTMQTNFRITLVLNGKVLAP